MSQPNYNTKKMVFGKSASIRNDKTEAKKPIYSSLSILYISKIALYEYWYDDQKPKSGEKAIRRCLCRPLWRYSIKIWHIKR